MEFNKTPPFRPPIPEASLSPQQCQVLDREVEDLLLKGAIEPTSPAGGFFSPIFAVPKKDGGWRPIINLRRLNGYIATPHFKMESIGSLKDVIQKGDFMGKLDLKDAYLSVPIAQEHRKYLRFAWKGRYYQFRSLPFGLASAPRTFTKLLCPVAAEMRSRGIRIIIYLDDILVLASSKSQLTEDLASVARQLEELGFTLNRKKCIWSPTQIIEFLGFIVNSLAMTIHLPHDKIEKIKKECRHVSHKQEVTACQLAHLVGLLSSSIPAIAPAPLHYRALQRLRNSALQQGRGSYDFPTRMDQESMGDLQWWIHEAGKVNGRPIVQPTADLVITSDASMTGWGATYQSMSTGGSWTRQERMCHINLLELKAVFIALQIFAAHHSNCHILSLVDNTTAIAYINHKGGTHSRAMSNLAIEIWEWCMARNLTIHAEHIPGCENIRADMESRRSVDPSDWCLNRTIFKSLEAKWGPFDVDLFAARHNKQLERFFSFRPDPQAEAIDALAQPWTNLRPYAFPPFILLGRIIRKIRQENVKEVVVIAPIWANQSWFPLLLGSLVDLPIALPEMPTLLSNPLGEPHPLILQDRLRLAAWKVSGVKSKIEIFLRKLSRSSALHGGMAPKNPTHLPGQSGYAGAVNGVLIPFQDL